MTLSGRSAAIRFDAAGLRQEQPTRCVLSWGDGTARCRYLSAGSWSHSTQVDATLRELSVAGSCCWLLGVNTLLPSAAAAGVMTEGRSDGCAHVEQADGREHQAPERRAMISVQRGLEGKRHQEPGEKTQYARHSGREKSY